MVLENDEGNNDDNYEEDNDDYYEEANDDYLVGEHESWASGHDGVRQRVPAEPGQERGFVPVPISNLQPEHFVTWAIYGNSNIQILAHF